MYNPEIQAINQILQTKSLDIIYKDGVTEEYFLSNKPQIEYILEHKKTYGVVPDTTTFSSKFRDFPIFKVTESRKYLADKIIEATLFQKVVPIVNQFRDLMQKDSLEATDYIIQAITDVKKQVQVNQTVGTDIIANAMDRYTDYQERVSLGGLMGITTGIPELDEVTHGWVAEDYILLFARTNEGKSWVAEYLAINAWKSGKKILYYAGEMSPLMMGYRFDTLYKNISNTALLKGNAELEEEYKSYLEELSDNSGLVVITQQDFNNKKPKISQIKQIAQDINADLVILDQLSLLDDEKSSDNKTTRYGNISQDIKMATVETQKPWIVVAQANREAEKDKKTREQSPQLHHVEYSDTVVQDATRVISLKYLEGILTVSLKKNRFGGKNVDVMMKWDIDKGIIEPMLDPDRLKEMGEEFGF